MPEYLASGVFVEEVSFRAKSIEGVGTSVTGLVGPTRTGLLRGKPELLICLGRDAQREWKSFLGDVRDLLKIVKYLLSTPENQLNTCKLMGYLRNPNEQSVHLSADFIATAKTLRASSSSEEIFR